MNFSTQGFQKRIDKPWGYEIIYTPEGLGRVGKILFVKAGCKLSFQYHDKKEETLSLFSGKALIWLENDAGEIEKVPMTPTAGYTIKINQKHRIEALEDSFLIEVSDPEQGTTIRVEDDYQRPDETETLRQDPSRGWSSNY